VGRVEYFAALWGAAAHSLGTTGLVVIPTDRLVDIVTIVCWTKGNQGLIPDSGKLFVSLLHIVQTGPRVHPASYPMNTVGSFPGG
jgi:hypothetical protein